jgi:hypothetical protein
VAVADLEGSAALVALMVTACGALIVEGAVYHPFDKLPMDGLRDQVTEVFESPVTVAVNCALCEGPRVTLDGLTLTFTPAAPGGVS